MLNLPDCDKGAGRPRVMCAHRWQRHGLLLTEESHSAGNVLDTPSTFCEAGA